MKTCTVCGEQKEATPEFYHRHVRHKDGYHSACKVCRSDKNKANTTDEGCEPPPKNIKVKCMHGCDEYMVVLVPSDFKGKYRKQCDNCDRNGPPEERLNI